MSKQRAMTNKVVLELLPPPVHKAWKSEENQTKLFDLCRQFFKSKSVARSTSYTCFCHVRRLELLPQKEEEMLKTLAREWRTLKLSKAKKDLALIAEYERSARLENHT